MHRRKWTIECTEDCTFLIIDYISAFDVDLVYSLCYYFSNIVA